MIQKTIKGNRYIKLLKIIKYESKKTGQTETEKICLQKVNKNVIVEEIYQIQRLKHVDNK